MSSEGPRSLSVKRKASELPVDSLVREGSDYIYHRIKRRRDIVKTETRSFTELVPSPRRFHFNRIGGDIFLVENKTNNVPPREGLQQTEGAVSMEDITSTSPQKTSLAQRTASRKRPGARSAVRKVVAPPSESKTDRAEPSEETIRQLEKFADDVEKEEVAAAVNVQTSPRKFIPKPPKQRIMERRPELFAPKTLDEARGSDAMDLDDGYVIDTYERVAKSDMKLLNIVPDGSTGVIVLETEEDEDFWNAADEEDEEPETDEDDENAESYYANDYPDDELSSDDEQDRNPYKYYRDEFYEESDDEEGHSADDNHDDDDDDDDDHDHEHDNDEEGDEHGGMHRPLGGFDDDDDLAKELLRLKLQLQKRV